jgi:hypothetical protein
VPKEEFLPIIQNVERHILLSDEEKAYFTSLLRIVKVKKKQLIAQPDFVCKYKTFIVKGALRCYLVAGEGQEHTFTLAIEDYWIAEYYSYIHQVPGIDTDGSLESWNCTFYNAETNTWADGVE